MKKYLKKIQKSTSFIRPQLPVQPEIALVLGSGLGALPEAMTDIWRIKFADIPHFPVSTKHLLIFFYGLVLVSTAQAQDLYDTSFKKTGDVGFFFGPTVDVSDLDFDFLFFVGGHAALSYGDVFIGTFGMHGLPFKINDKNDLPFEMNINYGGPWIGYRPKIEFPIHPYFGFKTAWGNAAISNKSTPDTEKESYDIYIIQPEFGMEFILTKHLHLIGTGGYKWINKLERTGLIEAMDSRSMVFCLSLQFGWF